MVLIQKKKCQEYCIGITQECLLDQILLYYSFHQHTVANIPTRLIGWLLEIDIAVWEVGILDQMS